MFPPPPDLCYNPAEWVRTADRMYPTDDAFTEAVAWFGVVTLQPYVAVLYACEVCGCQFRPDNDAEGWWPDRMVFASNDGGRCKMACRCHDLPGDFWMVEEICKVCGNHLWTSNENSDQTHHFWQPENEHLPVPFRPVKPEELAAARAGLARLENDLSTEED